MLRVLELFGGIGAPRKALINLGVDYKVIDYVEIDQKAVKAYNALYAQYPTHHHPQSVVGYHMSADVLIHGSPCQDFSNAGKRRGANEEDNTRSSLMWQTIKIIENMGNYKPKFIIWENVRGALSKDMIHNFEKYLSEMERLGYTNSYAILNAMDYSVPQRRERVFVVSILGDRTFDFSKLEKKETRPLSDYLETEVSDLYTVTMPSMVKKINKKEGFRLKPIKDFVWTITTSQTSCPNAGIVDIGEGNYRILTERECWRLMGFSDEDFDAVLKAHPSRPGCLNGTMYKLAGNSIVVDVLEAIFKELLKDEI